jgi:DNA-binding transcriptional ArsR family regulator
VDAVFAALADPTRRRLLDQLSTEGPLTATQLATSYPVSRQAVVKHLGTLAAAGLLDIERRGREVRYGVAPARLDGASAWLADVGTRWDSRLEALRRQLELPSPSE